MLDEVDFAGAIDVPEIDGEDVERGIDLTGAWISKVGRTEGSLHILDIDFLICELVAHDEADAGRGSDRSPVLGDC